MENLMNYLPALSELDYTITAINYKPSVILDVLFLSFQLEVLNLIDIPIPKNM
jgi:hypothetical protein